jgi:prepilin-type N-terminal cleavage/methylation domain-containing protein
MNCLRNKGVTLAETMIVVAITAMFAVIAFPSFSSSGKYQLDLASQELSAGIRFARNEALRTGEVYGIDINRSTTQFTIYKADLSVNPVGQEFLVYHPINKNLYTYNLKNDFNLQNISIANATEPFLFTDSVRRKSLLFTANGIPVWIDSNSGEMYQLQSGNIQLAYSAHNQNISVEPFSGRVLKQ